MVGHFISLVTFIDDDGPGLERFVRQVGGAHLVTAAAFGAGVHIQKTTPRKILQLPYNKRPVRPRLTVSLKPDDFELLAERYELSPEDQQAIREKVSLELIAYAELLRNASYK